jgi:hypothetical protein
MMYNLWKRRSDVFPLVLRAMVATMPARSSGIRPIKAQVRFGLIASLGRRSASSGLPQSTDMFRILSVSPRSQSGGR